jgi:hypothetical protein
MPTRAMLEQHLSLADRHVTQAEAIIDKQLRLIIELTEDGHDTSSARQLLAVFEGTRRLHEADRDRLLGQLEELK